jgi:hypothetical protein
VPQQLHALGDLKGLYTVCGRDLCRLRVIRTLARGLHSGGFEELLLGLCASHFPPTRPRRALVPSIRSVMLYSGPSEAAAAPP